MNESDATDRSLQIARSLAISAPDPPRSRDLGAQFTSENHNLNVLLRLLDDSLRKKLRFWFSDTTFQRQSQQTAEILVPRRSFSTTVSTKSYCQTPLLDDSFSILIQRLNQTGKAFGRRKRSLLRSQQIAYRSQQIAVQTGRDHMKSNRSQIAGHRAILCN